MSGGAPQENQTIKKVREKSNNQNPTNTTFPSHSFSVIKTIKIPGKSREKENTAGPSPPGGGGGGLGSRAWECLELCVGYAGTVDLLVADLPAAVYLHCCRITWRCAVRAGFSTALKPCARTQTTQGGHFRRLTRQRYTDCKCKVTYVPENYLVRAPISDVSRSRCWFICCCRIRTLRPSMQTRAISPSRPLSTPMRPLLVLALQLAGARAGSGVHLSGESAKLHRPSR